jgi:polyhydroxyalkanoate synthesis regulator phasin
MALPEQIRKQSEAIAKMYDGSPADPAPATEQEAEGVENPASDEANGAEASAPEAARNEQTRPATTDETAEQRYRTLQGMYNADTARLRADRQELTARVEQLEKLLSSISAQPAQQAQTQTKLITEKDIEDYGDSIDVMRRVTKEETAYWQNKVAELENTLRDLRVSVVPRVEQVAQRQAVSADQAFWTDLTAAVPNWRDINGNRDFHSWLLEVDPLTGVTRQSHLENAQRSHDVRRVAAFFSTWQGNTGQRIAQEPRDAAKSQLEKQVAPGRGRAAAAPVGDQPKTYSPQDISKFFDDVRKGLYKGRETERDRIERDLFAAQREGRIVATG